MSSLQNHAAKVGHRKSRNGCLKCKARRVKCDELQPVCSNCSRLKMECRWPEPRHSRPSRSPHPSPPMLSSSDSTGGSITVGINDPSPRPPVDHDSVFSAILHRWPVDAVENTVFGSNRDGDEAHDTDLPESRARRLLEHRLMHNYYVNILNPFPVTPSEEWSIVWSRKLPMMALQYDNLLYAILSVSATNLLRERPDDVELFAARQRYLISAMREQRKLLASLTVDNADAVCFGALQILINSFAMLRERAVEPYEPPMDWLRLGRGAGTVIWMSVGEVLRADGMATSSMMVIANSYPRFGVDESYFDPEMRLDFEGILTQKLPSGDTWDEETKEAYEKALSYVGSVQKAIDRGEPIYAICRRIQAFPLVMPPKYIDLVTMQRPRALVVLAHFFATVAQARGVWWLGESRRGEDSMARREIRAISRAIPKEWYGQMIWPMDMVGLR